MAFNTQLDYDLLRQIIEAATNHRFACCGCGAVIHPSVCIRRDEIVSFECPTCRFSWPADVVKALPDCIADSLNAVNVAKEAAYDWYTPIAVDPDDLRLGRDHGPDCLHKPGCDCPQPVTIGDPSLDRIFNHYSNSNLLGFDPSDPEPKLMKIDGRTAHFTTGETVELPESWMVDYCHVTHPSQNPSWKIDTPKTSFFVYAGALMCNMKQWVKDDAPNIIGHIDGLPVEDLTDYDEAAKQLQAMAKTPQEPPAEPQEPKPIRFREFL